MNQLNINLTALALGIVFSTGAMAQLLSPQDSHPTQDSMAVEYPVPRAPLQLADASPAVGAQLIESIEPVESVESVESIALVAARKKAATARLDAMYEVAKEQCNTYPVGTRARCLGQMKTGFGK